MKQQQNSINLGQLQQDVEKTTKAVLAARRAFEREAQKLTSAEDAYRAAIQALRGGYAGVTASTKLPV